MKLIDEHDYKNVIFPLLIALGQGLWRFCLPKTKECDSENIRSLKC